MAKRTTSALPAARHRGRVLALQVLYEADQTGHPWREALRQQARGPKENRQALAFAEQCIGGVLDHRTELDALIQRFAPAWPVLQLSAVDRNILRLAPYELRWSEEAPPKVAINEAVELAKLFSGEGSHRFINGVLGSAWAEQQPTENTNSSP